MTDLDYTKLNRQQKLAIFLIVIGPEAAAEVLQSFDDGEIEVLCREMANHALVPEAVRAQVLEEFGPIIGESVAATLGGKQFVRRAVSLARGESRADHVLGRMDTAAPGTSVEAMRDLGEMEGRQIFNLLKNEQAQTVSFVLSHLSAPKAAEVFALLDASLREEVAERMGTIEGTALAVAGKVVRSLGQHFDLKSRPTLHHSGGARAVADLLNSLDKETSKTILARLEERNASLGAAVRKQLFSFDDLGRLQTADLQRVLREVETASLAIAMKTASEALREKIYGALSKRAGEGLRDEIGMLGPLRLRDIEQAQDVVIQAVRRLEEDGAISLDSSENALV